MAKYELYPGARKKEESNRLDYEVKRTPNVSSRGDRFATEEADGYSPSKAGLPTPKAKPASDAVESAGSGGDSYPLPKSKPSGNPGGSGSSREYPVPKRKPLSEYKSESSDGRDYAKTRDKAVVDASDRFNSSDHG